jgi:phage tail-like protein
MPGIGSNPIGSFSVGSNPGLNDTRSLADFNFRVAAASYGFDIKIQVDIPDLHLVGSYWAREIIILRKSGEWPQNEDDAEAVVVHHKAYPSTGGITETIIDTDLAPLNTYYYALFEKKTDGSWINDMVLGRGSAYPYDRWGFGDYIYSSLPRGWQRDDESRDLYNFCQIFGAILDDTKTDIEYLRSLFEISNIHEDLIPYLDSKIAWPTWHFAGGLKKRTDTANAVELYKLRGTSGGLESSIEAVSQWNASIVEGWKYVMFTNGLYDSKTPGPFPDISFLQNRGKLTDKYKYTNDTTDETRWHAVNGVVLYLEQLPASGEFNVEMLSRYREMISLVTASYANVALLLVPTTDEVYPLSKIYDYANVDGDPYAVPESVSVPTEQDLGYTTSDVTLFLSEPLGNGSLTPDTTTPPADIHFRTFHEALEYI